jgi:hypothetical protein
MWRSFRKPPENRVASLSCSILCAMISQQSFRSSDLPFSKRQKKVSICVSVTVHWGVRSGVGRSVGAGRPAQ